MSLLSRYLIRNNLFLLLSILLMGTGLYLLTDIFERLDSFLEAGVSAGTVAWFYLVKTPLIISQILPAVFLIAVIVQFALMDKAREMVALQSGGISPMKLLSVIIFYGLLWAGVQLAFSQVLGIQGDLISKRLWQEQVRGKERKEVTLQGLWFTEASHVVHLGLAYPELGEGTDFLSYELSSDGNTLESTVSARKFVITDQGWLLQDVVIMTPQNFGYTALDEYRMNIKQDLSPFVALEPGANPALLPVWDLGESIDRLIATGSNVEGLRTAYHAKFAYSLSIVVLGVLGLAIVLWFRNLYMSVGIGLLAIFVLFAATILCNTMGTKGILPPIIAAWGTNVTLSVIALGALAWKIKPRFGR